MSALSDTQTGHEPYPLILEPILVPKPWGGRRLEAFGKTLPDGGTYGESWDIADLPGGAVTSSDQTRSVVASGALAGSTLSAVVRRWGRALLGSTSTTPDGDFPLLYKLLDARENLSVQVHPDATYVANHRGAWLKTESWYIVDAEPGAVIYKGVRAGVTLDDLAATAGTPDIVELLMPVPARRGAFHHLPAGLVHALGAGVLVAEPQTPSDTTFRLYDWTAEYGRVSRPLHLDESIAATVIDPPGAVWLPPAAGGSARSLVTTPHYWMREHAAMSGPIALDPMRELRVLSVLSGAVTVTMGTDAVELHLGGTVVIPAAAAPDTSTVASGEATVLEIGLAGDPA